MWDQAKNPHKSQEKVEALIQRRRGKEEGEWYIWWNKEGLEIYYTVENWREVYNDKAQFSVLRMRTMTKEGT
jgi:hypothetical protein